MDHLGIDTRPGKKSDLRLVVSREYAQEPVELTVKNLDYFPRSFNSLRLIMTYYLACSSEFCFIVFSIMHIEAYDVQSGSCQGLGRLMDV